MELFVRAIQPQQIYLHANSLTAPAQQEKSEHSSVGREQIGGGTYGPAGNWQKGHSASPARPTPAPFPSHLLITLPTPSRQNFPEDRGGEEVAGGAS